ncbi:MAG: HD domain protein [Planctomycetes bacterium ADurb.Bin401]|nr:MAG: HD domain protein [Planctomycetes bacterium ADurb.Bin401]
MTKQQLEDLKKWFFGYVAGFYNNNVLNDENIKLKEDHTRRMCADTPAIADELGFDEYQKTLAEAISLLHDTGRFEQYKKYGTYNDVGTENHSTLGLKTLAENNVLAGIDQREKEIIETAIRLHGEKDLPRLSGEIETYSKLIRDIDKLDIYNVMLSRVDELRVDPQKCFSIFGYPATDAYSLEIVNAVLENKTISYSEFKTLNDIILGLLGWIADINFAATLRVIKKRGLYEKLISTLPDTQDIRRVRTHVLDQLEKRIASN